MSEILKRCWGSTNYKILGVVMIFSSFGIYLFNEINPLFVIIDLPVIIVKIVMFDLILGHDWGKYNVGSKIGIIIFFLLIDRIFQVIVVPILVYLFF